MNRKIPTLIFFSFFIFVTAPPGGTATVNDISKLKQAGLSDKTIQLIVKEKVIETAAFSVDDIVKLRKAGVNDKTLQILIRESSFLANSEPIIYGRETQSIRHITVQDVINLKNNGVSDSVIQSVIEATSADDEKDRERAWRMLEDMQLRIIHQSGR